MTKITLGRNFFSLKSAFSLKKKTIFACLNYGVIKLTVYTFY